MAQDKVLNFNIEANNKKALQALDEIQAKASVVNQTLNKVSSKSVANNSTVNSKDTSSVYRGLDSLQSSIKSLTEQMQTLKGARDNLLASGQGSKSDIASLNSTLKELTQGLTQVYRHTGADGNRISSQGGAFNRKLNTINNSTVRGTASFVNRNDPSYIRRQAENQGTLSSLRRQYNDARTVAGIDDNIRSAQSSGRMSYNNYQSTQARIRYRQGLIDKTGATVDNKTNEYQAKIASNNNRISMLQRLQEQGKGDRSAEIANLQKMNQEYTSLIVKLDTFSDGLTKAKGNLDSQSDRLKSSVDSGSIKVDPKAGSFMANMRTMLPRAARSAVLGVASSVTSAASQGGQIRQSMSSNTNNLLLSDAVNNGAKTNGDHSILNRLNAISISNGANYTNQQLAQLTGSFQQATGNSSVSQALSVADTSSKFGRFNNIQDSTVNTLLTNAGQTGAITNSNNTSQLESSIQNAINNSNMSAKAEQQTEALNSIYASFQGRNLSTSQAESIAGVQANMAKYGSSMQGTSGAKSYESLTGIFSNGFSSSVARTLFGGNSSKYAGIEGQAKLYDDMSNIDKNPTNLNRAIKNTLTYANGNTEVAAYDLSQMSGGSLSMDNAKKFIQMQKNGDLTSENIQKTLKSTKKSKATQSNKTNAYTTSGISSLDKASALAARNVTAFSQALDSVRKSKNTLSGSVSGTANVISSGIGSAGGALLAGVAGSGIISGIKGVLGSAKIAETIGKTKVGKLFNIGKGASTVAKGASETEKVVKATSEATKVGRLAKLSKIPKVGGIIATGTGIYEGIKGLATGSKAGQYLKGGSTLTKSSGILSKVSRVAKGGSTLTKSSGILSKVSGVAKGVASSGVFKTGSKLLGRVANIGTIVSTGMDASDAITGKKGSQKKAKGIGGTIGTVAGGVIGGALGAFTTAGFGTGAGVAGGAAIGNTVGEWIGSKFGKKSTQGTVHASERVSKANNQRLATKSSEGATRHNNQQIGGSQGATLPKLNMTVNMTVKNGDDAKDGAKTLGRNIIQSLRSGMTEQMSFYSNSLVQSSSKDS